MWAGHPTESNGGFGFSYEGAFSSGLDVGGLTVVGVSYPVIAVEGDLNFGEVPVGSSKQRTFKISNKSSQYYLTVKGITHDPGVFTGTFEGMIPPGRSQQVQVTFTPISGDTCNGQLSVVSDAVSGVSTLAETGRGKLAPKPTPGPTPKPTPTPAPEMKLDGKLDFGQVNVGSTKQLALKIKNTGKADLVVEGISHFDEHFAGDFSGTVTAGQVREVPITFSPDSVTTFTGTLTIASNAGSGSLVETGKGKAAPTPTPTPTPKPTPSPTPAGTPAIMLDGSLDFGKVAVGSSKTAKFKIKNTGKAALHVRGVSHSPGIFSGDFSGTIEPGKAQEVTVTFAPVSAGEFTGQLTVISDATSGNGVMTEKGKGEVKASPTPTPWDGGGGGVSAGPSDPVTSAPTPTPTPSPVPSSTPAA